MPRHGVALPTTGRAQCVMTPRIVGTDGVKTPPNVPSFPSLAATSVEHALGSPLSAPGVASFLGRGPHPRG